MKFKREVYERFLKADMEGQKDILVGMRDFTKEYMINLPEGISEDHKYIKVIVPRAYRIEGEEVGTGTDRSVSMYKVLCKYKDLIDPSIEMNVRIEASDINKLIYIFSNNEDYSDFIEMEDNFKELEKTNLIDFKDKLIANSDNLFDIIEIENHYLQRKKENKEKMEKLSSNIMKNYGMDDEIDLYENILSLFNK